MCRFRDFTMFVGKTSYRLVNRGPVKVYLSIGETTSDMSKIDPYQYTT